MQPIKSSVCLLNSVSIFCCHLNGMSDSGFETSCVTSLSLRNFNDLHHTGGSAPMIVFDDADIDVAVRMVIASKFRNAGQTCISGNRILVQRHVHDRFSKKLVERVQKLKIGHGMREGVSLGPLIDSSGCDKVKQHVEDAVTRGGEIVYGGSKATPDRLGDESLQGSFYMPTVLLNSVPDMRIWKEETFGPVCPIMQFDSEEEAVTLANNTEYGLAAYYFTSDLGRSWRVGEALNYGLVGCNDVVVSLDSVPFGGWKSSGIGREGGIGSLDDFLEKKTFIVGGLNN